MDAVLDASLQRRGDKVRVTVRLLNVTDETTLWTYQCDEQYCADLLVMQDAISEKIAAVLITQLLRQPAPQSEVTRPAAAHRPLPMKP